jgi:U3 small nucleolar RNA-associated protein 14
MQMKFMQRGEERRKKENDEAVAELRRQLDSDDEAGSDEEMEIGRRQFGMGNAAAATKAAQPKKAKAADIRGPASSAVSMQSSKEAEPSSSARGSGDAWASAEPVSSASGGAGVWSQVESSSRKSKKAGKAKAEEFDISNAATVVIKASKPKAKSQGAARGPADQAPDSDSDDALHLPMAIRDQKLIERAFAGEDVHGQFEDEKADVEQADDDKEIDNTLPGWGNWVGDGVSARETRRHQGRFITKVDGVKKKDRKDFKLKDVIINEKRIRKVSPARDGCSPLTNKANSWHRTTSTSLRSCRIRSSRSSSTNARYGCPSALNGRRRRRSRMPPSRGSLSSRASLRPCRSPCIKGGWSGVICVWWCCMVDRLHKNEMGWRMSSRSRSMMV